jgi:hypothetical protein
MVFRWQLKNLPRSVVDASSLSIKHVMVKEGAVRRDGVIIEQRMKFGGPADWKRT